MNLYYSTINIPECKRGAQEWFPDTPRTASLVSSGILIPVQKEMSEPGDVPAVPSDFKPRKPR